MLPSLGVIPLVICLISLCLLSRRLGLSWPDAICAGATAWAVLLGAVTEIGGLFGALRKWPLMGIWSGVSIAICWLCSRRAATPRRVTGQRWRFADWLLAVVVTLIALTIALTAVVSPPNTMDAQVYHLPRVVFWSQQGSVANFATNNFPQIEQPPGAEFIFLQTFVLSGTDWFVNSVSCLALLLASLAAALITGVLGGGRRSRWVSALLILTIPSAVLEASGPKNDVTAGCWLLLALYFLLQWQRQGWWQWAMGAGAALGLALLTKGTTYLFAPPILLLVLLGRRPVSRRLARDLFVFLVAVASVNAGFWWRNFSFTGSPLGAPAPQQFQPAFTNEQYNWQTTVSNLSRNLALHLVLPDKGYNRSLEQSVRRLHQVLGIAWNDPSTTWPNTEFRPEFSRNEALAGDPWQLLLFLVAASALLWRNHGDKQTRLLVAGITAAFCCFCLLLKWQPWHSRLHIPLLLASAVPVSLWLSRSPRTAAAVAAISVAVALPYLLSNETRPLLGSRSVLTVPREAGYENDAPAHYRDYRFAARQAKPLACRTIGLDSRLQPSQYALLHELYGLPGLQLRNVVDASDNPSARYESPDAPPLCAVLCASCRSSADRQEEYQRKGWMKKSIADTDLFIRPPQRVDPGCRVSFTDGWYAAEADGPLSLRWMAQRGSVRIQSSQTRLVELQARLLSPLVRGAVDVTINGAPLQHYEREALPVVPVWLQAGENVVEFVSSEPPVAKLPDPRPLAIGLKGLRVVGADYSYACAVQP